MITEQKQNRRKKHRENKQHKFRHFDEDTFNSKIDYRKYCKARQLINNIDMLGGNKQSIIWLNQKLPYNELQIYVCGLSTYIS